MLIAEESHRLARRDARRPDEGGLGFDYKWNMGWMHDTLHYMEEEPVYRRWHHDEMTFGLVYAFSEKFVLPLSHDEVVHGKGSLIGKMPGDDWQRFANLRAYFGFMWTHPGKKLLFMGGEFAPGARVEPRRRARLGPARPARAMPACSALVRDLNAALSRRAGAACARIAMPDGFRWVVLDDARAERVRLSPLRRGGRPAGAGGVQLHAGAAPRLPHRRAARRAGGGRC